VVPVRQGKRDQLADPPVTSWQSPTMAWASSASRAVRDDFELRVQQAGATVRRISSLSRNRPKLRATVCALSRFLLDPSLSRVNYRVLSRIVRFARSGRTC